MLCQFFEKHEVTESPETPPNSNFLISIIIKKVGTMQVKESTPEFSYLVLVAELRLTQLDPCLFFEVLACHYLGQTSSYNLRSKLPVLVDVSKTLSHVLAHNSIFAFSKSICLHHSECHRGIAMSHHERWLPSVTKSKVASFERRISHREVGPTSLKSFYWHSS